MAAILTDKLLKLMMLLAGMCQGNVWNFFFSWQNLHYNSIMIAPWSLLSFLHKSQTSMEEAKEQYKLLGIC